MKRASNNGSLSLSELETCPHAGGFATLHIMFHSEGSKLSQLHVSFGSSHAAPQQPSANVDLPADVPIRQLS
jgi:hypothetical protein